MSGRPNTDGARALLAAVTEAETIAWELPRLQAQHGALAAKIKERSERHAELRQEIVRLLDKMDCDGIGNHGWEARFTALLSEMLRLDRQQRAAPVAGQEAPSTSPDLDAISDACGPQAALGYRLRPFAGDPLCARDLSQDTGQDGLTCGHPLSEHGGDGCVHIHDFCDVLSGCLCPGFVPEGSERP